MRGFGIAGSVLHAFKRVVLGDDAYVYDAHHKWLRLKEARRLMLAENTGAATAAFNAG
jgi:hypothetical protein